MLNELITIFFFSGTGGVRKIAKELEKQIYLCAVPYLCI